MKSIVATIQPGQNGPKWFVQLFPKGTDGTKSLVIPISFYILESNKVCDVRVQIVDLTCDSLEWYQHALEFLKSFSTDNA